MPVDIIGFVYAGVVAAGGIMGYVKAGTKISIKFVFEQHLFIYYFRVSSFLSCWPRFWWSLDLWSISNEWSATKLCATISNIIDISRSYGVQIL